ncbi:nuclear transport factor 2 family protein [Caulobacter mirabilis]|uniref:Dehydrogenase n=1 Tax=Caulobacter mirabilis TaxID=69666 RepID=A0A2D2B148_9CAUL|nr:nuclear transport factor 2 family protein [Caulobacter mirabilis]ATQ43990.1 dehydrogenase [Caulobacter mirabilis]
MNRRALASLVACGAALVATSAIAQPVNADEAAIRAVIETYFKGHATGDPAYFRAAFLPTAHIEGNRGGKFTSWTVDEYAAGFKGTPASDESSRSRTVDVIDVTGDSAMARATLDHGAAVFTDYFVLLKIDGGWKIANKVYSVRRKAG